MWAVLSEALQEAFIETIEQIGRASLVFETFN